MEKEGREGGNEGSGGFLSALVEMKRNNTGGNLRHHLKTVRQKRVDLMHLAFHLPMSSLPWPGGEPPALTLILPASPLSALN